MSCLPKKVPILCIWQDYNENLDLGKSTQRSGTSNIHLAGYKNQLGCWSYTYLVQKINFGKVFDKTFKALCDGDKQIFDH